MMAAQPGAASPPGVDRLRTTVRGRPEALPAAPTGGHECDLPAPILSPGRCCTPDLCTGETGCRAPVHIHGCYGDVPGADCTAPGEHR